MTRFRPHLLAVAGLIFSTSGFSQAPLALTRTLPLPGVQGRFDHFCLDDTGKRLFAAVPGNHSVEVVDVATGHVLESVKALGKPHGVAWVNGRLFVADGAKAELAVFSGQPLRRVKAIPLSDDADDMVYDPAHKLLYVGHGGSGAESPAKIAVIDTDALAIVASLPVAAHPEALELDPETDRIFANIADAGRIAVIDGKTHTLVSTWTLHDAKGNTPLAFDAADHMLLVAARSPARLLVLDARTGTELSRASSADGADDLFFDPMLHRVFLIAGSGTINSYTLDAAGTVHALPDTATAPGAKTGLLDSGRHRLYVGIPDSNGSAKINEYAPQ